MHILNAGVAGKPGPAVSATRASRTRPVVSRPPCEEPARSKGHSRDRFARALSAPEKRLERNLHSALLLTVNRRPNRVKSLRRSCSNSRYIRWARPRLRHCFVLESVSMDSSSRLPPLRTILLATMLDMPNWCWSLRPNSVSAVTIGSGRTRANSISTASAHIL